MKPPIDSEALKRVLASLPPKRPDPFPHLAHLCIAAELRFGVPVPEVRGLIKALPQQAQPLTSTYICLIQEST